LKCGGHMGYKTLTFDKTIIQISFDSYGQNLFRKFSLT